MKFFKTRQNKLVEVEEPDWETASGTYVVGEVTMVGDVPVLDSVAVIIIDKRYRDWSNMEVVLGETASE